MILHVNGEPLALGGVNIIVEILFHMFNSFKTIKIMKTFGPFGRHFHVQVKNVQVISINMFVTLKIS